MVPIGLHGGVQQARRSETVVQIELMATVSVLKRWRDNPALTKREIGVWSHWTDGGDEMDVPLTQEEVAQMREFVRRVAPSIYANLQGFSLTR
jgi:hypothetical protein